MAQPWQASGNLYASGSLAREKPAPALPPTPEIALTRENAAQFD